MTFVHTWRVLRGRSHSLSFKIDHGDTGTAFPWFGRWYYIEIPGYWIELQRPSKKVSR